MRICATELLARTSKENIYKSLVVRCELKNKNIDGNEQKTDSNISTGDQKEQVD